jgi:hypothetical protein
VAGPEPAGQEPADGWVEVYVPPADLGDVARALLDAAGEDPVEADKVQTLSGGFRVPRDIADRAGVSPTDDNAVNPAATGTQAAFAPSPEPVSGDAVIAEEADRGTASPARPSGRCSTPQTEAVSGDAVIQGEADSGNASPEAVGAVFAQNSPTGEGADANADDDAQPQPEPEADDWQPTTQQSDEEPQPEEQSEEDLRGEDLDDALRAAGLSAYGRVADKRARLAAHRAAHGG